MPKDSSTLAFQAGGIPRTDRIQRLVIGGALMLLTFSGFVERIE